jgi:DNA-binding MarR family transcriptional regulator
VKYKAVGSHFAYSLYFSAGALAREAEKLAIACWKPVGLSPSQAQIIMLLTDVYRTGPASIAKTLLLSPSTVTRLLDGLERKELINRFDYGGIKTVSLTEKANALEEKFSECDLDYQRRYTKFLGSENASGLMEKMNEATDKLRGVENDKRPDGDTGSRRESRYLGG